MSTPNKNKRPTTAQTNDSPAIEPESPEVSIDTIPHHPPITPNGFRNEELKAWFMSYYPDLAAWIYAGLVSNQTQPTP
jgi:hypothetical protein